MEPSVGDHHAQSAFGARKPGMDPTHLSPCAQKKLLSHSGWESHLSAPSRQGWGSYLQGCTDSSGLQGLQGLQGLSSVGLWLLRDRLQGNGVSGTRRLGCGTAAAMTPRSTVGNGGQGARRGGRDGGGTLWAGLEGAQMGGEGCGCRRAGSTAGRKAGDARDEGTPRVWGWGGDEGCSRYGDDGDVGVRGCSARGDARSPRDAGMLAVWGCRCRHQPEPGAAGSPSPTHSKVSAGIFSRSRRAFIPPPPPLRSAPLSPSHRQPPRWAAPTGGRQRRHRRERSSARRARTRPCRSVRLGIARRGSARLSTVRHCSARPARFGAAPSGSARLSSARHGSPSSSPHSPDGAGAARGHRAPGMRRGAEQRSRTAQNSSGTAQ